INYYFPSKYDAQLKMLEKSYILQLTLSIGERLKDGADYFDVFIYNIDYVKEKKILLGHNSIIVDIDDIDELEKEIKLFVNSIYGYSWNEVLNKLRKYFKWEYEDY
ncbi:Imm8 family immunity protein, partial [Avibacterium paragallinarum]